MLRTLTGIMRLTYVLSATLMVVVSMVMALDHVRVAKARPMSTTFVVTNTDDSGSGSLRQAILDANINPGTDVISINVTGTLYLSNRLWITDAVMIHGSGSDQFAIDGQGQSGAFLLSGGSDHVHLTGLTIQNGNAGATDGGGIWGLGSINLFITDVNFINNTSFLDGGGISLMSGSLSIEGGRFQNNRARMGGGFYVNTGAPVIMHNTQFISNAASIGGGGFTPVGVRLDHGAFISNIATGGGALYVGQSLNLTGTQFISNTGRQGAGAVYVVGHTVLNGGLFQANVALSYSAGALHVPQPYPLSVSGTQFLSNSAVRSGGAILAEGPVTLSHSLFQNNQCTDMTCSGGGLRTSAALDLQHTAFVSNIAQEAGGGISVGGAATLTHAMFQHNQSHGNGGGFSGAGAVSVNLTQFMSNSAGTQGGGLYANRSLNLVGSEFSNNVASGAGGGVFAVGDTSISDGFFINNQSANGAGGGLNSAGTLTLISTTRFMSNVATDGGALRLAGDSRIINSLFANNIATLSGAAAYLEQGTTTITHVTLTSQAPITGAAIYIVTSTVNITDTIITSHTVGISNANGIVTENYNLFFGNVSNTVSVSSGGNSLDGDPRFVNPLAANYHLSAGSAAIDVGTNAGISTDFDGELRPQGAGFDMGFDEAAPAALISGLSISIVPTSSLTISDTASLRASVTGGSLPIMYAWSLGDGSAIVSGNPITHIYTMVGDYMVVVTAANSANSVTTTIPVNVTTMLNNSLKLYLPLVIH